jgi:mRNA interferase MazF
LKEQVAISRERTIICAVITSNINQTQVPENILLEKFITGLDKTSVVNFSQIFTVDKTRFIELVTMLPKNYITKIVVII